MKRLWVGVVLLAALLAAGLWSARVMTESSSAVRDALTGSARAADLGHWKQADAFASTAQAQWRRSRDLTSALADHTLLDEIDALFAQAEVYRHHRHTADYAATCLHLAQLIDALQESHRLNWRNLL